MTEFEMASLHAELIGLLATQFMGYFTVLSAFMVASYLAAHRLTATMAVIGVGSFGLFCLATMFTASRTLASVQGLSNQMRKFAEAESGLAWHGIAQTPQAVQEFTVSVAMSVLIVSAASGAYFFFHCRRVNRQAQTVATSAKPSA